MIDGFRIQSGFEESFTRTFCSWSHVEKKIAVHRYSLNQSRNDDLWLHVCIIGRCSVVTIAEWVQATGPLPFPVGLQSSICCSIEIALNSAAVVDGDLSALPSGVVEVASRELSRHVRSTNVAPHEICSHCGQDLHLRQYLQQSEQSATNLSGKKTPTDTHLLSQVIRQRHISEIRKCLIGVWIGRIATRPVSKSVIVRVEPFWRAIVCTFV